MRSQDEKYIGLCLKLARKAKGLTSPNPCVGAVLVKSGRIIATGYHRRAGGPHAEICALRRAGKRARGATLYVSLEPCSHYGRTPPCAASIISSGVRRVVAAMKDPNPINNGRGLSLLRKNGIETKVGILEDEARELNEAFIKFISERLPFVTVKVAETLDGKIATKRGDSKWISGARARDYAHNLRSRSDAILVGLKTVLKDDPLLTARPKERTCTRQPVRVVLDDTLRTPLKAKILNSKGGRVIIATTGSVLLKKKGLLEKKGAEIITIGAKRGRVDIKLLLKELARRDITNVLIEGGGEVIASAFEAKVVDKAAFFITPKIIGGRSAPTSVEGRGIETLAEAIKLKKIKLQRIGEDLLVEGYL